jgi:glycosyltransferase involved in cell wall biosynthesis
LIRRLYSKGIYGTLLDWHRSYEIDEFQQISQSHDAIVTTPTSIETLVNYFQVPPEKVLCVVHGEPDFIASQSREKDLNKYFSKIGMVAKNVLDLAPSYNVTKNVQLLRCGVDFDFFYSEPPKQLNTIGYAASFFRVEKGADIKRGHLVQQIAEDCGLNFNRCKHYHFASMPAFYANSDCIIQSSTMESIGLPMIEAACAGRLTIGTEIGYIHEVNNLRTGGIVVPMDKFGFVDKTKQTVNYYKANPDLFNQRCKEIQEYARYNYDWEYFLDDWEAFLT